MVFFAIATGGMIAACGSISVLDPDGGPSGSGGITGGATGGSGGGGTGGGAGHAGGIGGRAGGSGAGGVTGAGGRGGTVGSLGGTPGGLGGFTGGGLGGVSGGLGGTPGGLGGFSGGGLGGYGGGGLGGGSGGLGGSGGGGASCAQLQRDFTVAFLEAKGCVIGAAAYCLRQTSDRLDCGCPTFVSSTVKLDPIRAAWAQNGCSSGICTPTLCSAVSGAVCSPSAQTGQPVCVDQSGVGPSPI